MNKAVTVYDPAVVDQAHARMESDMINAVNHNSDLTNRDRAWRHTVATLQKAQATQIFQHTKREARLYEQLQEKSAQLWAEKKNARTRALRRSILREALLIGGCCGSAQALVSGLLSWELGVPVMSVCALGAAWIAGGLWHEFRAYMRRCR